MLGIRLFQRCCVTLVSPCACAVAVCSNFLPCSRYRLASLLVVLFVIPVGVLYLLYDPYYVSLEGVHRYLEEFQDICWNQTSFHRTNSDQKPCGCLPQQSTIMEIPNGRNLSLRAVELFHPEVSEGGHWKPRNCVARQRIAIIIPYRRREEHLRVFLHHMHSFLQRQNLDYQVFVIEQAKPNIFNRASLLNIGFVEARKRSEFDCYIFHDVDLLPTHSMTMYSCLFSPLHIGAYRNTTNFRPPYFAFFGGIVAITEKQMRTINGFSNNFYGWGGEDDDTFNRLWNHGLTVYRHPQPISKTYMLQHYEDFGNPINPKRNRGYHVSKAQSQLDGLNSVRYQKLGYKQKKLYTWLYVSIEKKMQAECVVNPNLPATDTGNYLDCEDDQMYFISGTTDCCRHQNEVYCCSKDRWYIVVVCVSVSAAILAVLGLMILGRFLVKRII